MGGEAEQERGPDGMWGVMAPSAGCRQSRALQQPAEHHAQGRGQQPALGGGKLLRLFRVRVSNQTSPAPLQPAGPSCRGSRGPAHIANSTSKVPHALQTARVRFQAHPACMPDHMGLQSAGAARTDASGIRADVAPQPSCQLHSQMRPAPSPLAFNLHSIGCKRIRK